MSARKLLLIDRDGTLIEEPADEQIDALDKLALLPDVIPALLQLKAAGYELIMVSNQDGLGTVSFPREDFEAPHQMMLSLFRSQGIEFDDIRICPHLPDEGCECRKPRIGLVADLLLADDINRSACAVIGDRDTDLELAQRLSLTGIRVGPQGLSWPQVVDQLLESPRRASVTRTTKETRIEVSVDLDPERSSLPRCIEVQTGLPFFDHMLDQIASHSGIAMTLRCDGDIDVDDHHSIEDCALALGEALDRALGDRRGIDRFGFVLPMDETRARCLIDLSGRALSRFEGEFTREQVGGMATEMVPHFFRSLADGLRATIHVVVAGDNSHHMVEACFKSFGRALRQALRREGRELPSSKGVL